MVAEYLSSEGFEPTEWDTYGGEVWKKGHGVMLAPQYIHVTVVPGRVHLEAWCRYALLPGVYVGEMGLTGMFGAAAKNALKKRVMQIEWSLGAAPAQVPSQVPSQAPSQVGPQWYPDPYGRHQYRYWDGQRWSDRVADGGVERTDPTAGPMTPVAR